MDRFTEQKILKVSDELGIVYGWAMVFTDQAIEGDDKRYFDKHGDHIPKAGGVAAMCDFMMKSREGKGMHAGDKIADVVFAMPITDEFCEAFGMQFTDMAKAKEGIAIAWKPEKVEHLEKFKSGEWTGFSIGGAYGDTEELADA